jgi:hypothetical protein
MDEVLEDFFKKITLADVFQKTIGRFVFFRSLENEETQILDVKNSKPVSDSLLNMEFLNVEGCQYDGGPS